MKRTASLFSQIVDYENLRLAWLKARKRCAFPRPGNASRNYECPWAGFWEAVYFSHLRLPQGKGTHVAARYAFKFAKNSAYFLKLDVKKYFEDKLPDSIGDTTIIYLDELISEDPKKIIDYINTKQATEGIDYIKVKVRVDVPGYNKTIINNYYRNNSHTFVEFLDQSEIKKLKDEVKEEVTEWFH